MAAHDPDIRKAVLDKARAVRLEGLDAAGRRALTAGARAELHRRDLEAVDAEAAARGETLDDEEREYRAGIKRRIRMADLALKSAQARKAAAKARRAAERDAELAELAALQDSAA